MNNQSAQDFFKEKVGDYKFEHYDAGYRTFMSVRQDRIVAELNQLNLPAGSQVLEGGCGPGLLTRVLYDAGFQVNAIDTSEAMLETAKSIYDASEAPPEFMLGNIESVPFEDDQFDLVVSAGVIEYLDNTEKAFAEFARVLKPGGHLIVSSTNSYSPIGMFEYPIEWIKRIDFTRNLVNKLLALGNGTPIRAREFEVKKHRPGRFAEEAGQAGFTVKNLGYFYMLPWPHPFDRVFPRANSFLNRKLERLSTSSLGILAEGLLIVGQKSHETVDNSMIDGGQSGAISDGEALK